MKASLAAGPEAMPQCVPLRWWSEANLRRLAEQGRAALQAWAQDWECTLGASRAWNASDDALLSHHDVVWMRLPSSGPDTLWFGAVAERPWQLLHRLMFGSSAAPADAIDPNTIANELARRANQDLQRALAAAWGLDDEAIAVDESATEATTPTAQSRPWSGAVRVRIALGPSPLDALWLHLPHAVAAHRVGEANATGNTTPSGALARVASAMERKPLCLRVALSPVGLDVGSLLGLRPGDVITTAHQLDEPLHVGLLAEGTAVDTKPLCLGQLGAHGDRKAVALDPRSLRDLSSHSTP